MTKRKAPAVTPGTSQDTSNVRLVGIGASAGGLEALERFFVAMPIDSGVAFAIVQHLSPDFRSMMDELLARHSVMRILHAADGMEIEPNTVYLNPPRQNLVIKSGRLSLVKPDPRDQPNHPIDAFFASLAADQKKEAIGVILSGTGSDGTKGATAILSAGGKVLVQDPGSAKFENMPRSAIEKGASSAIALPEEIPVLIGQIINGQPLGIGPDTSTVKLSPEEDILRQLELRFGANFAYYKAATVGRRLTRRAGLNGIQDLSIYANMLRSNPGELERLYADLLIGVTAFFRDLAAFNALDSLAISEMAEFMTTDRQLRVWVPGCATGEEAYSIAILLSEYARKHDRPLNAKIFATDLHTGSLATAAAGQYPARSLSEVPDDIRDRYFDAVGSNYQAKSALRRLIVFSVHNLIKDPPFTRLDLISCRNLLIYLDDIAQNKVLSLFHFALNKSGTLFLGPSEVLGDLTNEFQALDTRWRVYRKLRNTHLPGATRLLPTPNIDERGGGNAARKPDQPRAQSALPRSDRRSLLRAYDTILERHAPPSLLINRTGDLVHVFGNADRYIRVKPGLFSQRLVDVVIEPLKLAATACVDAARLSQSLPIIHEATYSDLKGQQIALQLRVDRLDGSGIANDADYMLVQFIERVVEQLREATAPARVLEIKETAALHDRISELERSLHFTEESLQTTIEELETSNEELQSTNEELMSANEELQSTNEELHAVNEELYSVSTEHRRKIDELIVLTNDMDNLLKCTDVGTIFLDKELKVRRFTPAIARTFNLLDRDIGRPIEHVTARFAYEGLASDISRVARTQEVIERPVHVDGNIHLLRIFPFLVGEQTQGTVLTLIDISRLKQAEQNLELRNQELARANESLQQFTYIVAHDLRAPMRTILNSAKWIEEDLGSKASDEIRDHCHRLMTYSARLTDMLADLMSYSRLGTSEAPVEQLNLTASLQQIIESIDGDERIDLHVESAISTLAARRSPFQLVLQNLIDNALKYSDQPRVTLNVKVEDTGGLIKFTVNDDGPGIPKRHQDKIFLPFRKLEHADKKPGTGMGLALVKKAVEDNGGSIHVLSDPPNQRGTTFVFTWATSVGAM